MSVDLSNYNIQTVYQAITSKSDHTSCPPSSLDLLDSGSEPTLDSVRKVLEHVQEEVVFGYAEIKGKGLVIAFLKDSVGGVRRARAVVHSRAVASLFPDYVALMTVAHHSQLSDEEVHEKLGLNHQPPTPVRSIHEQQPSEQRYPAHLQRQAPVLDTSSPTPAPAEPAESGSPLQPSPPVPEKDFQPQQSSTAHQGDRQIIPSSSSVHSQKSQKSSRSYHSGRSRLEVDRPSTPLQRDLQAASGSTPQQMLNRVDDLTHNTPKMKTPSGQPSPLPLAPPILTPHQHHPSPRIVSAPSAHPIENKGISSADLFDTPRQRKTSLTSRLGQLGQAFGKGSQRSTPNSPITPTSPRLEQLVENDNYGSKGNKSPNSPTLSKFMNSSLVKNFGRRSSGGGGPSVPKSCVDPTRRQSQPPPPLPPKDNEPSSITPSFPQETNVQTQIHPYQPSMTSIIPVNGHFTPSNGAPNPSEASLARSQSAQKALFEASQKRLKSESEIQERFRREEEERQRSRYPGMNDIGGGDRDSMVDWGPRKTLIGDVLLGAPIGMGGHDPMPDISHLRGLGAGEGDRREREGDDDDDDEEIGLPYDRPDPDSPQTSMANRRAMVDVPNDPMTEDLKDGLEPHEGLGDEIGEDESVTARIAELDLAEDGQAGGTGVEMSIQAEQHAEKLQLEREEEGIVDYGGVEGQSGSVDQLRVEEEQRREDERRIAEQHRVEEEEKRRREEERIEEERLVEERRLAEERMAEEQRLEEERVMEQRRIEAARRAEEARIAEEKRAEEERVRAIEEQRRMDEQRRVKEERKRVEAERQRVEDEKKKKEEMINGLRWYKGEGSRMVAGWMTVQTSKSPMWRRRYFHLYPTELRLFKQEGDSTPILTIPVGRGMKVLLDFEELQTQGSFKLTDMNNEDYFMFTDKPEDREVVLTALGIIGE